MGNGRKITLLTHRNSFLRLSTLWKGERSLFQTLGVLSVILEFDGLGQFDTFRISLMALMV
jgi:hypothetical protein